MSEWYDSQKKQSGNFRKLLQERLEKVNQRLQKLTKEEATKPAKLEAIAVRLKRGENVQSDGLVTQYLHTYYEVVISV